jgi:lysophospholipase L1-like esterase
MKITLIFLLTLILTSCTNTAFSNQTDTPKKYQVDYNILFVGNSLTYTNDLPKLVRSYATTKGLTIKTKMLAKANFSIVDHLATSRLKKLIKSKKFDYVVIQQGPSSQQNGFDMLVNGGDGFAQLCNDNNAQLAYFMVWPSLKYYHTFQGVISNYTSAAISNKAILIPVGTYWKDYIAQTGDYSYYNSDGFHPSKAGSQKAAEIIVDTLFLK